MRMLTDVPFAEISVGDRVWNAAKTSQGTITSFDPTDDGKERGKLIIDWDNGNQTVAPIFLDDCQVGS